MPIKKYCITCQKEFYVHPCEDRLKCCSLKCSKIARKLKPRHPAWTFKGCKHTEEWKQQLSKRMLGNKYTRGHKLSLEHKRKISLAHKKSGLKPPSTKGLHWSKEARERFGIAQSGKNNPSYGCFGRKSRHWKGGKTALRKLIMNLYKYKVWRDKVFKRDKYTCQRCYKRGVFLEAHHLKSVSIIVDEYNLKNSKMCVKCKELWDVSEGITLCKKCHRAIPRYRKS